MRENGVAFPLDSTETGAVANLFALAGIIAGALLIVACWLEARGRARYRESEQHRDADVIRAGRRLR